MKTRHLLTTIALGGLAFTLVGCGSKNAKAADNVSLAINYYNGGISQASIDNAKKHFKHYHLNFKRVASDGSFDTKLKASLNSSAAPDITMINSNIADYTPYYKKFVNLQDYGTKKLAKEYVSWKWRSTLANNDRYQLAMPVDVGPTAFFYNVKNFQAAGLPTDPAAVSAQIKTPAAYMQAAKQMKTRTHTAMFESASETFAAMDNAMTKHIYDDAGKLTLADGQLKDAWDFSVQALKAGYVLNAEANTTDGVVAEKEGKFSGMIKASWGIADLKENGVKPGEWLIAKSPLKPSNYGGSYLAAIKTTKHPAAAAAVIKYLTNTENQSANYKELSLFPSKTAAYDQAFLDTTNPMFGTEKFNQYFVDSAKQLDFIPTDPRESAAYDCFAKQLDLVANQHKDPAQAWKDAVAKAKQLQK